MDGGPSFFLLSILLVTQSCCSFTHAQPEFWISEVYNNFTNFADAFVEIYDGGIGSLTLTNISLELEKQNNVSLMNISLDQRKTNSEGFLVLSFNDSDDNDSLLKIIQSETVILKLFDKSNDNPKIIDIFKKEKGWSDVMSCFRNESGVNAIVLVGEKPSKGVRNICPLSPVRLDLFMYSTPFKLSVQLVSHDINQFSLINHFINLFENDDLLKTFPLTNYSTEKEKVNISMDVSQNFDATSSYRINLEIQINATLPTLLESLYFGAPLTSAVNMTEVFQTYPDKNPAQLVSPVYLQIVPDKPINFASCYCEVSASTYNSFVSISSSAYRNEKCQEKCNDLITKPPTASQTPVQITSSSLPEVETTITADQSTTTSSMDFEPSTVEDNLTTEGLISTTVLTHSTTENLSTVIAATDETNSSTVDFYKYSTFPSVSEAASTDQKFTSTEPVTAQKPLLPLYFNEIKVGSQPSQDHWIELKGNTSFETVSSYQLVLNVSGEKNGTAFDLKSLESTDKDGLLYINSSTHDASQLLQKLDQNAGLLRLFSHKILPTSDKSTGLADCVAYQIEGSVLEKKLADLCPFHKLKQITLRELHQNWTIGRCKGRYEVLEPSADQPNRCPSLQFSKPVYMKILKRKLDTNFKAQFISSLVQKLSADKGCMLSTAFFLHLSANTSADDLHIQAFLAAPNQTKLNALYMCFKTLFHKKPIELQLGSDKVKVYRCYNSSFIIPTATKQFAGKNKTLAIAITLLVLFVCLVAGCCIYMRYRRRSLLEVFGIARYNADQDDLLVNMEDIGRLDTNFRNPTYSQLTAY